MSSQARPTTRKLNFDFHHNERPSAAFGSNEPRAIVPSAITSWKIGQKEEIHKRFKSSPSHPNAAYLYQICVSDRQNDAFKSKYNASICVSLLLKISVFVIMRSWLRTASILIEFLRNIFDLFTLNNKKKRLRSHIVAIKHCFSVRFTYLRSSIPMPKFDCRIF